MANELSRAERLAVAVVRAATKGKAGDSAVALIQSALDEEREEAVAEISRAIDQSGYESDGDGTEWVKKIDITAEIFGLRGRSEDETKYDPIGDDPLVKSVARLRAMNDAPDLLALLKRVVEIDVPKCSAATGTSEWENYKCNCTAILTGKFRDLQADIRKQIESDT